MDVWSWYRCVIKVFLNLLVKGLKTRCGHRCSIAVEVGVEILNLCRFLDSDSKVMQVPGFDLEIVL